MLFFAKRPSVIAPENDDRIFSVGAFFKGIKESTHVHVGIGAGGEVGLDRGFPAPAFQKLGMIRLRFGHFNSRRRNVIEIILQVRRKFDFIERKILIIFAWRHKCEVWLVEPAGNEIGLLTLL